MVVVRAKVRERRQAQRQARQAKSKKKNRCVIKVMRFKQGWGWVPLLRENQMITKPFNWSIINYSLFILTYDK